LLTNTVALFLLLEKLVHELEGTFFAVSTLIEPANTGIVDPNVKVKKLTTLIKKKLHDSGLRTKVLIEVNEDYHDATIVA